MKKKILTILAAALCAGGMAMAAVPDDSIALGGIVTGMTKADVEGIYGASEELIPYQYVRTTEVYTEKIGYGDSVVIWLTGQSASETPKVDVVVVSANNGFTTPEGIHVGSTKQEVLDTYGEPDIDYSKYHNTVSPTARKRNRQTLTYKGANAFYKVMTFTLENGVVTQIGIGAN